MSVFPASRLRRLRRTDTLRAMVRETALAPGDFILPFFVTHGRGVRDEVSSMPGVYQLSVDELYALGYQLQIEPTTMLGVAVNAMVQALALERQTGRISSLAAQHGNLYELMDLWMNVPEVRRIRESYVQADLGIGSAAKTD